MSDCIFCRLLSGELEVSAIYKDAVCFVFLDAQPVNPGHMLVIPNRHAAYLADLDEDEGAHLFRIAQRIAAALRKSGVKCEGVNLFLADGEAASQEVFHVHLHVFPRYIGDGFGLKFPPDYSQKPDRTELDTIAETIKAVMHS
jgi:histidine triad (HIT) family protein